MWIYNKQNNSVDEQPTMDDPNIKYQKGWYGRDQTGIQQYHIDNRKFREHIASLKSYPVSGIHSWEDKQELQEGKDFEVWRTTDSEKRFAKPLPVIKQESENNGGWKYDYDFLYNLTLKINDEEGISMEQVEAVLIAINYNP